MEAAARMPPVDSAGLRRMRMPSYEVRLRGRTWILYKDGVYEVSLRTRDEAEARAAMELREQQDIAALNGLVDPRWSDAEAVCDAHVAADNGGDEARRLRKKEKLDRLRPFLRGLRVADLDERWFDRANAALSPRYAPTTLFGSYATLAAAIRRNCRANKTAPFCPFEPPSQPPGRNRVLTAEELARLRRYCAGDEFLDPETGEWTRVRNGRRAGAANLHMRRQLAAALDLGLGSGSRGGKLRAIAFEPSTEHPFVDLEEGVLWRLPMGRVQPRNKRSTKLLLPPSILERLRRIREEAPHARFVLHARDGGEVRQGVHRWFKIACGHVGIEGVTPHVLRHTVITEMVRRRIPARVISAVCGITIEQLTRRYDHTDDTELQDAGHAALEEIVSGRLAKKRG